MTAAGLLHGKFWIKQKVKILCWSAPLPLVVPEPGLLRARATKSPMANWLVSIKFWAAWTWTNMTQLYKTPREMTWLRRAITSPWNSAVETSTENKILNISREYNVIDHHDGTAAFVDRWYVGGTIFELLPDQRLKELNPWQTLSKYHDYQPSLLTNEQNIR